MYYKPLKKKQIDVVVSRASSYSLLASLLLSLNLKIKIMTYKEANNISIKDYLNSFGIQPVTEKGSYGMYRSPLREDNTPSFKVDYNVNLWCDYGTGEGGTLIDLVMKQHGCNAYGAICRLEQGNTASFSFHGKDLPERDTKRQAASPIEIRRIQPLQNPALIRYLQERGFRTERHPHTCRKCITASVESLILRWHSKMIQEVTSFAIPVSRAAHRKTLPIYGSRESREIPVSCSRAFWISSHSSLSGNRKARICLVPTGRTTLF